MIRNKLAILLEVSRDSSKPTKMIAEQENKFWNDCKKRYSSIKLLKDRMNMNEIEHQRVKQLIPKNAKIYL